MITHGTPPGESIRWKNTLKEAIRCPKALLAEVGLSENQLPLSIKKQFGLLVPRPYLSRIKVGDPQDPLLRQVLPLAQEEWLDPTFSTNPLEEDVFAPVPGLLHKFESRVLLTLTGACPVHCRYCFRRYFPYSDNVGQQNWAAWVEYCRQHPQVKEVVLSGGDPLSFSDDRLERLLEALIAVPSIEIIRFHTRFPIMIPERVTDKLLSLFRGARTKIVVVVHCNHPNEIDTAVEKACQRLVGAGVILLNQSVLLSQVNDHADTLCELSWKLIGASIMPYYVHLLDKVQGSSHFLVSDSRARSIEQAIKARLPGYLVPRFVREVPGHTSKQALAP